MLKQFQFLHQKSGAGQEKCGGVQRSCTDGSAYSLFEDDMAYNKTFVFPRISQELIHSDIQMTSADNRLRKLQDECDQLIAAINHYFQTDNNIPEEQAVNDIAEEISDVLIMSAVTCTALRDAGHGALLDKKLHDKLGQWKWHVHDLLAAQN